MLYRRRVRRRGHYLAESVEEKRRGFLGSFLEFGTLSGFIGGTFVVLVLQNVLDGVQMQEYGWRIPFLLAVPLGLTGWYLRNKLEESAVFTEVLQDENPRTGLVELFTNKGGASHGRAAWRDFTTAT